MTIFNLRKSTYLFLFLLMNFNLISCAKQFKNAELKVKAVDKDSLKIKTGAERTNSYLNLLKGKKVGIVANQTSVLSILERAEIAPNVMGSKKISHHLVDYLFDYNLITVKKVFAPEHGFRGKADAAALIQDGLDTKTGLPILSLHGKSKKPSAQQLENIDIVVFDIQDVGVRFYTYISTLHYVMEACAENGIPLIILDRPNPNGHYIDGPILEMKHTSFVGKHPVPVVYGMTIGEYGQMINGEKWLKNGIQCDLKVIPLENYTHNSEYHLPIRPSPNLPNDKSINLYPSLGFFEGTTINAGRGTEFQFQRYGAPFFPKSDFSYTPISNFGAKYPKHKEKQCYGVDLRKTEHLSKIDLSFLIDAYKKTPKTEKFFGNTFTIHAGNTTLQKQIEAGLSAKEIEKTWKKGLETFKKIREQYLIYE
ncbi:exo-beta-N-acetylmuramidase NamZ domain-containing protein [Polaribacter sp. R77954]|uniref:exo-beta-N-acetylmuramidase NamZ family protein n=1 Tax=Polaribacter sp. R77954 TaxID=3093870 RepID=UPI0037CC0892